MTNDMPDRVLALLFAAVVLGLIFEFAKHRMIRQAGGSKISWAPWKSTAEVRRIRKSLEGSSSGSRIDLFGKLATVAWIAGLVIIAAWKFS
jgi:hypothetical protein